jgi:hypothetical protein
MPVIFQVPYRTHCLDGAIVEAVQALYCSVLLFMYSRRMFGRSLSFVHSFT